MVHSSITDHILKRSSFWLALAMPLKFGIVGKLLVRRTRESFPFRERRWHIWITSSSESASADWLCDSNGRSLWPISAAYGATATTVSTVSTVICVFFFCNKWRPLSWVECLSGSHATLQRRRKWVNLQVAGFDTIFQRWTGFFFFFICSGSLHPPSVLNSSSHSSSISSSSSESVAPTGLTITCSTWRKWKNLKKRLSEARVAKKSKVLTLSLLAVVALVLTRSSRIAFLSLEEAHEVVEDRDGVATRTAWPLTVHCHVSTHASYAQ